MGRSTITGTSTVFDGDHDDDVASVGSNMSAMGRPQSSKRLTSGALVLVRPQPKQYLKSTFKRVPTPWVLGGEVSSV